jgi:hypothetical protein
MPAQTVQARFIHMYIHAHMYSSHVNFVLGWARMEANEISTSVRTKVQRSKPLFMKSMLCVTCAYWFAKNLFSVDLLHFYYFLFIYEVSK